MSLPGFTAEASLYLTNEKYRFLKVNNFSSNKVQVIPQNSQPVNYAVCFSGYSAIVTTWWGDWAGWCHIEYQFPGCSGYDPSYFYQVTAGCRQWY